MSSNHVFPVWDDLYRSGQVEKLPWYWPAIDPDLDAALARHRIPSPARALDLGTGPGTQALVLAERGFDVTAADISPAAIAYVEQHASGRNLALTAVVDDVLATKLAGPFDVIFDRGCFHTLAPDRRSGYVLTIDKLLAPEGWLFLKTFSHLQPGEQGPYRFRAEEIREAFRRFHVLSVEDTVYQGTLDPFPKALFTTIRR